MVARTATNIADSSKVSVLAPVNAIAITPATPTMVRGDSLQLAAALTDVGQNAITNVTPSWSSSDPTKVVVSNTGMVTAVAIGSATITAQAQGKSASVPVAVVSPVASIGVAPTSLTFASLTATQTLVATAVPKAGVAAARITSLPVTWASLAPSIASVDNSGVVTAVANGSTMVTVTIDGIADSIPVTVKQLPTTLHIAPKSTRVASLGSGQQFAANAADAKGQPVVAASNFTWQSLNATIASVNSTGFATALASGTVGIIVSSGLGLPIRRR